MLMMIISKNGEINKKTPISRNWTLLANKVEQKLKRLFIKGFYCRLLFTWSGTFVLCSPLLPPFTQLTVCQSHHHHHHGHFHCRWLCNLYLGGGILWQSRFLFVIHILSWSTKSVKQPTQAVIQFSKELFNTFGQRGIQWRGASELIILAFVSENLYFRNRRPRNVKPLPKSTHNVKNHRQNSTKKTGEKNPNFNFF